MIKLLLTLIMMFTFGTSAVNAEENTTNIEDRISELAEVKSEDSQSVINAKLELAGVEEMESEEYVARHNFPIIFLFSLGLATLIFFILVNLGLISQD